MSDLDNIAFVQLNKAWRQDDLHLVDGISNAFS